MSAGPVRTSGGAAAVKAPVLLLYGEEYANLALADELALDGYEVRRASDAVTLRAACDTREIDVLILGQTARRGCGLEVLRQLRAGALSSTTPPIPARIASSVMVNSSVLLPRPVGPSTCVGLYRWLGEQHAQQGTGPAVRPDGYGRYLLPDGEIAFYLEIDRGSEPTRRVKAKLDAYQQALAADPHRDQGNILLVCEGRRRLANLARCAPPGPPWVWGTTDRERYTLLPGRDQQRTFAELPAGPRRADHHTTDCLGRRWRHPTRRAA